VRHGDLPGGLRRQRTTDEFDASSAPPGLLHAHRLATGVWGVLAVTAGSLSFVWEGDEARRIELEAGDSVVIEPDVLHHVEPGADGRFHVEFYR
jgi:tellurite resistance-related uncharacterized protein